MRWTTYGEVRGGCEHVHKSKLAALRCLHADERGCKRLGGYSDRAVVQVDDETARGCGDGTLSMTHDGQRYQFVYEVKS